MVAMASACDQYQFTLAGLTPVEDSARRAAAARAMTTAKAWAKVDLTAFNPLLDPPKPLKALVRGGIPQQLRPSLWLLFSGGAAKKAAAPAGYYAALQRKAAAAPSGAVDAAELGLELSRAFGTHPLLSSGKGLRAVLRLLEAYQAHAAPKMGLGRGMAAVAAFLLVVMGAGREEDAFWTLLALTHDRVPTSCVVENTRGTAVEQRVLEALLAKRLPKVATHLAAAETPLADVSAAWFHSLFASALPPETVVRVWDVLLLEGPKILFRVALALFKMNEVALLGSKHSLSVGRCIKWRIARCYDADALLKVAFGSVGSLPTAVLKRVRADYEGIVAHELAEHRRRLEAVLSQPARSKQRAGNAGKGNHDGSSSDSEAGSSTPLRLGTIHEEAEDDSAVPDLDPSSAESFLSVLAPPRRAMLGSV